MLQNPSNKTLRNKKNNPSAPRAGKRSKAGVGRNATLLDKLIPQVALASYPSPHSSAAIFCRAENYGA